MIKGRKMDRRLLYIICVVLFFMACSRDEVKSDKDKILIDVQGVKGLSKAGLIEDVDDMVDEKEFTINAYLTDGVDTRYMEDVWVYYFNGDWRFRDRVNQSNLIDYYWPNDRKLNFVAYMPHDLDKTVVDDTDISFSSSTGISINCTLPDVIDDITDADSIRLASQREFIYAYRKNQGNESGVVSLRFIHPFSAVKFKLKQSHRDLRINYIMLQNICNSARYVNDNDTYVAYPTDQDALTYERWTSIAAPSTMTINIGKIVPGDINFDSDIGAYHLVIPQALTSVKLIVNYTWDGVTQTSPAVAISTPAVTAWQPGMKYVYSLNLGDNKEEILFKVDVEEWEKGEDEGYENDYDVQ